jgi:hypothetical protein
LRLKNLYFTINLKLQSTFSNFRFEIRKA